MSRRTICFVAAGLVAIAAAGWGIARLARTPPTDEELVARLFDDAARAAEERRVSDAVAGVSERFSGQGLDRRAVKQLVAFHALRGEWVSASIAGRAIAIEGDLARATVDVVLARSGKGKALQDLLPADARAYRIATRLEREKEGWRIVAASWRTITIGEAMDGPAAPEP